MFAPLSLESTESESQGQKQRRCRGVLRVRPLRVSFAVPSLRVFVSPRPSVRVSAALAASPLPSHAATTHCSFERRQQRATTTTTKTHSADDKQSNRSRRNGSNRRQRNDQSKGASGLLDSPR